MTIKLHNIRDYATGKHRTVDDAPYGGGAGMVMKPEPIVAAIEDVVDTKKESRRIYFSPQGKVLKQSDLQRFQSYEQLVLLCGHYEGVDERVMEGSIDEEISIGDYVLTGGELPAMVFVDALTRLIPGVVGSEESLKEESFSSGVSTDPGSILLEYPHYTRPPEFRGMKVPEVLLSGDHAKIEQWRREQAKERTKKKRPVL